MLKKFLVKNKVLLTTVALVAAITTAGSTLAVLTSQTGSVANYFGIEKDVTTHIDENPDPDPVVADKDMMKQPWIMNDGPSNAYVRARITVTPTTANVKLYSGTWYANGSALYYLDIFGNIPGGRSFTRDQLIYDSATGNFASKPANTSVDNQAEWTYNPSDGFFYYRLVTSPDPSSPYNKTATLFDAINTQDNCDVVIYQESVYAPKKAGAACSVDEMQAQFLKAER